MKAEIVEANEEKRYVRILPKRASSVPNSTVEWKKWTGPIVI
ncbi:MAG: hypothetical protein Q4Q17_02675 [Tissierellia bacterium]|nr:hypothetical protein [Tissierellia bacterium]